LDAALKYIDCDELLPGEGDVDHIRVFRDATTGAFAGVPPQLRRSLIWDQGQEMSSNI